MKRSSVLLLILALAFPLAAMAQDNRNGKDGKDSGKPAPGRPAAAGRPVQQPSRQLAAAARQPVVINMSHSSSGGHNRNFPAQQPVQQQQTRQPSYGQIHWSAANQTRPQQQSRVNFAQPAQRPSLQHFSSPGVRASNVVHHHPYTPGYVRGKLRKIGVTAEPSYITDRSEIIHTDRLHSTIRFPQKGPGRQALNASIISPRHFNDEIVRDHMALVGNNDWRAKVDGLDRDEIQANHYYWHQDNGFNYCHYIDNNGYHWYGWYVGNQYFWNRYYNGRWWNYDSDFDRWCFWNNGFWWWQDPYHVGDLYCYNNDGYIPTNSAEDQIVVTAPDNSPMRAITSPDGTRIVKLDQETEDAFLYDTANPPTFDPIYLASGVKSVQFSDTSNGRPLEIILSLNDGSFDMFDGQGNPYNPGAFDADQSAQGGSYNNPPSDNTAPPSPN